MTAIRTEPRIDVNIPRANQAAVAVLTAVAFLGRWPQLVALTFLVLAISVVGGPRVAPLARLYLLVAERRRGAVRETEPAAPPRFAQQLGAAVLAVATIAFVAGWTIVGWAATLLVAALATLAATTRICVGCLLYEWWAGR